MVYCRFAVVFEHSGCKLFEPPLLLSNISAIWLKNFASLALHQKPMLTEQLLPPAAVTGADIVSPLVMLLIYMPLFLKLPSVPKKIVCVYRDKYFQYSSASNFTLTPSSSETFSRTICSNISTSQNLKLY